MGHFLLPILRGYLLGGAVFSTVILQYYSYDKKLPHGMGDERGGGNSIKKERLERRPLYVIPKRIVLSSTLSRWSKCHQHRNRGSDF